MKIASTAQAGGSAKPDRKKPSVTQPNQVTHPVLGTAWKRPSKPAPAIESEAENPSGKSGAGQAATARAGRRSSALACTFAPMVQTTLNHRTY